MKTVTGILSLLIFSSVASAQSPDPSKWMCRNLADSGNFTYQGETIFGTEACRPIAQAVPVQVAASIASASNSATTDATSAPPPAPDPTPIPRINDGKIRLYVTDEPKDESIFLASHRSGWQANGNSSGDVHASGGSSGAAVGYSQKGADPRTVEIEADLYEKCPSIIVTDDPPRADYVLLFRREGGKRTTMFAMGGLTGLAISAHSKVDGASVFDTSGDMVFATRARTVGSAIKEVCPHLK